MNAIVPTLLIPVAILPISCATTPDPKPIDLATLESAREAGGGVAGPWTPLEDGITNLVPDGVEIAEGQVRDGTGVSIGLLKGFNARNLAIEANVNYSGGGAPGLIFRAQEKDGVITDMYAATLFANGANVWRFSGGRWMLMLTEAAKITPRVPHALRVEAKGDRIQVYVDGQPLSELRDDSLTAAGRAGIRALEGPCKFSGLRASER
ncbi:MAG: hypothetical protein HUU46_11820 [Candidatus Hydrogenedentes bacterium]|nr:hypothetical protein [Candidatus Hydrogenedentota bacterium]